MTKRKTMTDLLRQHLQDADSIRGVAREAGLGHTSLVRFINGQSSLRLDKADALAAYFGIESRPNTSRKGDD
jgi:hypothetical protein